MLRRLFILLVAVLSASGPLTRGYCQLTCMTASATGQPTASGHEHTCHDDPSTGAIIGAGGSVCGHRGETPVASSVFALGRFSDHTELAVAILPPIVALDIAHVSAPWQPPVSPHDCSRTRLDVLRV